MNDDLIEAVVDVLVDTEIIGDMVLSEPMALSGFLDVDDLRTIARAAVAAHTDYLLALGGVTEDDIRAPFHSDDPYGTVRGLSARLVAQAVADKDAEIERARGDAKAWLDERGNAEYRSAHARAERAEAKVARVEVLCRDLAETLNDPDVTGQREDDIATILRLFRAALSKEER